MLKIERQTIIEQNLEKQGTVLVPVLAELLQCSEETVRRDLKEMEAAGKLARTHGGAYLIEKYDKSYPTTLRKTYLQETKNRLARQAVGHIGKNEVILLDSSTTCFAIAEEIVQRDLDLTLITNSLPICNLCDEHGIHINLVCLGGTFRQRTSSFTGYHTTDILCSYQADKAFISCPKVTMEFGLSDNHLNEARVREEILKHAQESFLVADHTKFGGSANILFQGLERISAVITDQRLPGEWEDFLRKHRVGLEYCT